MTDFTIMPRKTAPLATRLSRIKASKKRYELRRPARASLKVGVDLYRRFCRLRDERGLGESNEEFLTHLLAIYEEKASTSNSEPASSARSAQVHLESSYIIDVIEKANMEAIQKETSDLPQPSEQQGYQTFMIKEEILDEDSEDSNNAGQLHVSEEPRSQGESQSGVCFDSSTREDMGVGWREDNDHKETLEDGERTEGVSVHKEYFKDACGEDMTSQPSHETHIDYQTIECYIKKEPLDSDYSKDFGNSSSVGMVPPSLCEQAHNSSLESSFMGSTLQISADATHRSDDGLSPKTELGIQSDSSKGGSSTSEYGCSYVENHAPFQEGSIAERAISHQGSSQRSQGWLNAERMMECKEKCGKTSSEGIDSFSIGNGTFSSDSVHKEHVSKHSVDEPCEWSVCHKKLLNKNSLRLHMQTHTGEKPYTCAVCGRAFSSIGSYSNHVRNHTKEKLYCSVCKKGFTLKHHLKDHMRIHTGEKPFQCSDCPAKFAYSHALKYHMKSHMRDMHFCSFCSKSFGRQCDLVMHMRSHTGEQPYQCSICKRNFSQISNLKKHMASHSGERPFKCFVCNNRFKLKDTLDKHIKIHAGEKPYQCSVCGKRFLRSSGLSEHMRIHTRDSAYHSAESVLEEHVKSCKGDKPHHSTASNLSHNKESHTRDESCQFDTWYRCSFCSKSFGQKSHLAIHTRSHTGEKPYQCSICKKDFSQSCNLKRHMASHSQERPFKCSICNNRFREKGTRDEHMKIHTRDIAYEPSESVLADHVQSYKGDKPHHFHISSLSNHDKSPGDELYQSHTQKNLFRCSFCSKSFGQMSHLVIHIRSHTGEKPYQCSICKKGFSQKNNLKKHMASHSERPFKCSICKNRYRVKEALDRHMRLHTGEKLYQCSVCGKRFLRSCDRSKHACMRIHGKDSVNVPSESVFADRGESCKGDKPHHPHAFNLSNQKESPGDELYQSHSRKNLHRCSFCSKSFVRKSHLVIHIRSHTGEKPYQCSICKKEFSQRCNLKTHMASHSEERPFKCSVCNNRFRLKDTLVIHMRSHTGEKPYQCFICKRDFSLNSNLKKHMVLHLGEQPFKCSICNNRFREKDTLDEHMKIHTRDSACQPSESVLADHGESCKGDKPYHSHASNLSNHKESHTEDESYQSHTGKHLYRCSFCSKSFQRKYCLVIHMRSHTGEKPYQCSICKKDFSQSCNLKRHMTSHSEERPFTCSVCNNRFTLKDSLDRHMKIHTASSVKS